MPDMNEQDIIKTFEKIAQFELPEQALSRDLAQVREMLAKPSQTRRQERRSIWKSIMKSRISQLATAASLIAGAFVLWRSMGTSSNVYALSDVPRLIAQADTVHFRSWHFHNGEKRLVEHWFDLENGRGYNYSEVHPTSQEPNGFEPVADTQAVSDGSFIMNVDHKKKSVKFEKLLSCGSRLGLLLSREWIPQIMFQDVGQLDAYTKVGKKEIDGQPFDVWQRQYVHELSSMSFKHECWVSPVTGDVALTRRWEKNLRSGGYWTLVSETDQFERNAEPPPSIFATDPPAGFRLENSKATAEIVGVGFEPFRYIGGYRMTVLLSLVLEDGSILACWNSENPSVVPDANELFASLETGGPIPQTPLALLGLTSSDDMNGRGIDVKYVGVHMLHTRKAGRIYEWALYVPESEVTGDRPVRHNIAVLKFNTPDPKLSGQIHTWSLISLPADQETFDAYFREAVLELSDDGTAPKSMHYEQVLQLAGQVRSTHDLYDAFESELKQDNVTKHVSVAQSVEVITPQQAMQQVKQRVEDFFTAIIEERKDDAVKTLTYQEPRASRIVDRMKQLPGLADIKPEEVYAEDEKALVISSEFEVFEGKTGRWAISVIREKGVWLIRDFDATTTERMAREVEKFLKVAPQAQHFSVK